MYATLEDTHISPGRGEGRHIWTMTDAQLLYYINLEHSYLTIFHIM